MRCFYCWISAAERRHTCAPCPLRTDRKLRRGSPAKLSDEQQHFSLRPSLAPLIPLNRVSCFPVCSDFADRDVDDFKNKISPVLFSLSLSFEVEISANLRATIAVPCVFSSISRVTIYHGWIQLLLFLIFFKYNEKLNKKKRTFSMLFVPPHGKVTHLTVERDLTHYVQSDNAGFN